MTEQKPTIGTIDASTLPDEILTHEAQMRIKNDIQRDAARANTMPANHAENVIKDAEELEAKSGTQRHYDAN